MYAMISLGGQWWPERGRNDAGELQGAHVPQAIILLGVRWSVAYPLSYRPVEELMAERRVCVDHATIQRWVVQYSAPQVNYLKHMREPDHRGVTWVTRPRLGFKSCAAAQAALSGIELMHLLKKDQWIGAEGPGSLRHPSKFVTEPIIA
jgi:transposase-like protein